MYELSSKYGVASSDQVPLPARLDELREHIRREIRKVCRVSFVLLRTTPLPRTSLSLSFSPYTAIYTVAWLARAAPIPRTTEEYPFLSSLCNAHPLDRFVYPFPFLLRGRGTEKSDMCQATVDPWHAR